MAKSTGFYTTLVIYIQNILSSTSKAALQNQNRIHRHSKENFITINDTFFTFLHRTVLKLGKGRERGAEFKDSSFETVTRNELLMFVVTATLIRRQPGCPFLWPCFLKSY